MRDRPVSSPCMRHGGPRTGGREHATRGADPLPPVALPDEQGRAALAARSGHAATGGAAHRADDGSGGRAPLLPRDPAAHGGTGRGARGA
eukprot:922229-Pleurochrysis_carterae.AAC.1